MGIYINIKKIKGVVFMNKRLMELTDKKFVTCEELEEIELMPDATVQYNGYSGSFVGYHWATVADAEEEEYDIYFKTEE